MGRPESMAGGEINATHSPCAWALSRYPMQHNKRRRTILRLFATLLKMADEINVILWAESWDIDSKVFRQI